MLQNIDINTFRIATTSIHLNGLTILLGHMEPISLTLFHLYFMFGGKYRLIFPIYNNSIAAQFWTSQQHSSQIMDKIWWLWRKKQVSQAGISNSIPQNTMGCNYLSLPEITASHVLIYNNHHISSKTKIPSNLNYVKPLVNMYIYREKETSIC